MEGDRDKDFDLLGKKPQTNPNYFMPNITSCPITDKQFLIQIYQPNSFINCFKFGIRHEGYTQ